MAKDARPGEMRTRIRILAPQDAPSGGGYRNPTYSNIYPDDRTIRCKWVSAFGTEAVQAQSLGLKETATLTLRYDPRITSDCVVTTGEGANLKNYDLMSPPNDVGGAHRWIELRVKRRAKAL